MASSKKQKEATRKRVAAWRAKQKEKDNPMTPVTVFVTEKSQPVTDTKSEKGSGVTKEDIDNLPMSLKFQLESQTRARKILHIPDNLKERSEAAVRRFRGF